MGAITVANTDWSIISAVDSALSEAAISGAAVFAEVTVTTSAAQVRQCRFARSPAAVIRYVGTSEDGSPEDVRSCGVSLELIIAAKVAAGADESSRLQEVLRLMNAAKNAVEGSPPAGAAAWGDGDVYRRRIAWGAASIDATAGQPWAVCLLPVELCYVLTAGTSH